MKNLLNITMVAMIVLFVSGCGNSVYGVQDIVSSEMSMKITGSISKQESGLYSTFIEIENWEEFKIKIEILNNGNIPINQKVSIYIDSDNYSGLLTRFKTGLLKPGKGMISITDKLKTPPVLSDEYLIRVCSFEEYGGRFDDRCAIGLLRIIIK